MPFATQWQGEAWAGGMALSEESYAAQGTLVAATSGLPYIEDSLEAIPSIQENRSISGSPELQDSERGLYKYGGSLDVLAFGGAGFGYLLKGFGRDMTVAALPGSMTVAPTAAATAGAGPAAGTYYYATAQVLADLVTGELHTTNWIEMASPITTTSGNLTNTITPTVISTAPKGYSKAGFAVGRTPGTSGTTGTECFLAYVPSGSTYVDNLTDTLSTVTIPATVNLFSFDTGDNPMRTYSIEKKQGDSGQSEFYAGCKFNTIGYSVKPGGFIQLKIGVMAQSMEIGPSSMFSVPIVRPLIGSKSLAYIQLQDASAWVNCQLVQDFDSNLSNQAVERYNFNGSLNPRKIKERMRDLKGAMGFEFESGDMLNYFLNDTALDIVTWTNGPGTTPGFIVSYTTGGTTYKISSWPVQLGCHMPNVSVTKLGTPTKAGELISQKGELLCRNDTAAGFAHQFQYTAALTSLPNVA